MTIKFIFKIMVYLILTVLNFVVYVLVFSVAVGMKPDVSMEYIKFKFSETMTDSTAAIAQVIKISPEMQSEIDKAKEIISEERDEVQQQRDSLRFEIVRLEVLKNEVQQLLTEKNKVEEDRMNSLAKIYDGMDQERVAEVFSQMPDSLVVAIMAKMKSNNTSLVLEFLQPNRSAMISEMLLGEM